MNSKFGWVRIFTLPLVAALASCGGSSGGTPAVPAPAAGGTAVLIESSDAGSAYDSKIVIDINGNAIAVWIQSDGTRGNIWANRYTVNVGWGTALLIETDNTGNALNPQIAIDTNGNALAVWEQGDGLRQNIWANRYTVGSGWGTAALIESDNGGAINPLIAVDANGNALAVWSGGLNIWANRYTAGSGWGTAALIESNTGSAGSPQIAIDASGNALAVWRQSDGTRDNIWANRYIAGTGWGTAALIESDNLGAAGAPQIAINASGNAIALWQQSDGTRNNIWANHYLASGGWGAATLIETDNVGSADFPQIGIDSNGNALAVWQQDGDASAVLTNDIWYNRYTVGSGWGMAALMETSASRAANPQIAMNAGGNAMVVWFQVDGTRQNIFIRHYIAGSGWAAVALAEIYNDGDSMYPQIAINDNGKTMAVWEQVAAGGVRHDLWADSF